MDTEFEELKDGMEVSNVYFSDACLAGMIVVAAPNWKYSLMNLTEVLGMGQGKFDEKVLGRDFDEIASYSSFAGVAYVALRTGSNWGLLKLTERADESLKCDIQKLCDFSESDLDLMLAKYKVNKVEFSEWRSKNPEIYRRRWLTAFKAASQNKDGGTLHYLRKRVFYDTMHLVKEGGYISPSGRQVKFDDDAKMIASSKFYKDELPQADSQKVEGGTVVEVWNEDTLVAAKRMLDEGYQPAVLNLASRRNPGGGVTSGAGAQEENLFRRTNLFRSMYQFAEYAYQYGLRQSSYQYPMDRNWGGVYTPQATVFKGPESDGYPLLEEPFKVDFIAVAAMNVARQYHNGEWLNASEEAGTRNKMRTIFRIALKNGDDSLVLGAFGCGAFKNPPEQIAKLFHETLDESEFKNVFRKVVFAIIDNHNSFTASNPQGNYTPFVKEFMNIAKA